MQLMPTLYMTVAIYLLLYIAPTQLIRLSLSIGMVRARERLKANSFPKLKLSSPLSPLDHHHHVQALVPRK